MEAKLISSAKSCLTAAYEGTLDFPAIVRTLSAAGFEGYQVDYRCAKTTYFLPSGESLELPMPKTDGAVAAAFVPHAIEQAVREAQQNAPGYTYPAFCTKVKAAGCAGYMVSFVGRRVVYFGRTAECHVEHFPS